VSNWHISDELFKERVYALRLRQSLPLEDKVRIARTRIEEWYDHFDGKVAVSYSGGKDSMVLLHLVRELHPEVPAVFANTGIEPPEIAKAVRRVGNVTFLKPDMSFRRVVETFGWPVGSKVIAKEVDFVRTSPLATPGNPYVKALRASRWGFLLKAPFKISHKCCDHLKENPLRRAMRALGGAPMIGTRAEESRRRSFTHVKIGGCNLFSGRRRRSTPLAVWTSSDVLAYIQTRGLELPSIYGEIVTSASGLAVTGRQRTGCAFCLFGLHMDGYPNRFEMLARTHPGLYRLVMDGLGLRDVMRWLRRSAPESLRIHFRGHESYGMPDKHDNDPEPGPDNGGGR
jgi:3'-phosphoadenosine 5'-phosphosulfate sulfotransferase (PAPS reductase)/FAD synthetase